MSTINILFLSAVPAGAPPLELDREYRAIEDALEASPNASRFRLFRYARVQRPELEHTLTTFQPQIIHFSGHGTKTGSLLIEAFGGQRWELDRDTIRTILKAYGQSVKMAVLNACHSEVTANTLRESVAYVVGNSTAVFDEAAIIFAQTLYTALFQNESLHQSFRDALKAVEARDAQSGLTPQLLTTPASPDPRGVKPLEHWLSGRLNAAPARGLPDPPPWGSSPTRADARMALDQYLLVVDDFDQFVAEAFPGTHARFGSGMNRVACTTLVLQLHSPEEVLDALRTFLQNRGRK